MRVVGLLAYLVPLAALGSKKASSACEGEAAKLRAEVEQLRSELAAARAGGDAARSIGGASTGPELSVLGVAAKAKSIAEGVIHHVLKGTDIDDKVVDLVSDTCSAARTYTTTVVNKVTAVDYNEHLTTLTHHDIYMTHVAPTMGKVVVGVQPYVDMYVSPALEKAKVYTGPALETAQTTYDQAAKKVHSEVIPAMERTRSFASTEAPRFMSELEVRVGRIVAPVYDGLAQAAPQHVQVLPSSVLDRVFVLFVTAFVAYYCLRIALFFLRIMLRLAFGSSRVAIRVFVALPLYLLFKILGLALWLGSGFYCCGLCAPRRRAKEVTPISTEKKSDAAKKDDKKAAAAAPTKATIAELSSLLETSKKKGKLDSAVKLLAGLAGTGKIMEGKSYPEEVRGKQLEKDTLKKALAKFKEVDLKKVGL